MSTVLVLLASSSTIYFPDDFGSDVERSVIGSLHFRPGAAKTITVSELEHIRKKHPELAKQLTVLNSAQEPKPTAASAPPFVTKSVSQKYEKSVSEEIPKVKWRGAGKRKKSREDGAD